MFLSLDSSQERQENSNSKAPSPSVDKIGGNSSCVLKLFHDVIHSRGREKMMKRKGMSCHTLPTSMISGVICYWSPPGLLNLLSKVNHLPCGPAFSCIYLQLLLRSIWRRSHTCRSGIWFFSLMQCTLIGSTKWVVNNCLHSKLDSIDKWLLH